MKRWYDNWDAITPIFKFSPDVGKVIYTTNAIESLNSTYRKLNRQRSVFPSDTALLKALYLATFEATKQWTMSIRNWGRVYGELSIMYEGRLPEYQNLYAWWEGRFWRLLLTCPKSCRIYIARAGSSNLALNPEKQVLSSITNDISYINFFCLHKTWNALGIPSISWNLRGTYMSTVILSGTTLLEYVQQAQNICGTDFPIIGLNRQYHIEPSKTFNSLSHTEVDSIYHISWRWYIYFNSLPHTEVDGICSLLHRCRIHFNSLPHTEVDRRTSNELLASLYFNSLPHTEVDKAVYLNAITITISTHYFTQR